MFFVDLPTADGAWEHVGCFETKEEAAEFIVRMIGCGDKDGNVCLISNTEE